MILDTYMQNYYLVDRKLFVWDLDRMRSQVKDAVKAELAKMESDAVLQDRQISQFASLLTVYHWLKSEYRREISNVERDQRELDKSEDDTYRALIEESLQKKVDGLIDQKLFRFVCKEIAKNAVIAANSDPLTDYIETIGALIQAQKITAAHFSWMADGTLKIWAKAVWDIYEYEKRGTDSIVRRDIVDEKLKELSELKVNGDLPVVNWTLAHAEFGKNRVRQRGYYLKDAVNHELLRTAFNWAKYRPNGSQPYKNEEVEDEAVSHDNTSVATSESAPF